MAKIVQLKSIIPQPIYTNDFDRANDKGTIRGSVSIMGGAIEKGKIKIGDGRILANDGLTNRILIGTDE